MAGWVGHNWQVLDNEDSQTVIGVTFGIGLLDEPIEAMGSLGLAFSALRTELARAVELGPGIVSVPEVAVDLGADTCTLSMRGKRETVEAAWKRLPGLFVAETIADDASPTSSDIAIWPADLVQRTGRNAACLAWLKVAAPDAHDRARALLPRLNPNAALTRAVFFTTDESLVGLAYPVTLRSEPLPSPQWATDMAERARAEQTGDGGGRVSVPTTESEVLLSAMIPRSLAGHAATRLILRRLATTAENRTGELGARLIGMGSEYCLIAFNEPGVTGDARQRLLATFAQGFPLMPDPWLDEALDYARSQTSLTMVARERRALGLESDDDMDEVSIRQALARAAASLHLALDFNANASVDHPRPQSVAFENLTKPIDGFPSTLTTRPLGKVYASGARGRTAAAMKVNKLVIAETAIMARVFNGPRRQRPQHWVGVDATSLLAVLENDAGALTLIDESFRSILIYPELFRHGRKLQSLLADRLGKTPRFHTETETERKYVRRMARQGKIEDISPFVVAAALIVLAIALNVFNNGEAPTTARIEVGDTSTLGNGTEITAGAFDVAPPNPDEPESVVTVPIKFCAGGNTSEKNVPPETQRTVSPDDFKLFTKDGAMGRLVDTPDEPLQKITLQKGECTSGDLTFKVLNLESKPRLSYDNSAGDDVIWYSYGDDPKDAK